MCNNDHVQGKKLAPAFLSVEWFLEDLWLMLCSCPGPCSRLNLTLFKMNCLEEEQSKQTSQTWGTGVCERL